MAIEALVNPDVLSWARLRSGYSESVLARKISVNVDKVLSWERGQKKPTFKQAQNIARVTNTPFGFLFLPNPPRENLPIPDLRTVDGVQMQEPSTELRDILLQALSKQAWYKDFLISHNSKPLDFIGSFTIKSNIDEVVQSIRNTIGVSFPVTGTWNDYQRELIHGAESAGVMVMRSGIVGNNTHRKLQVSEFRGFAISDVLAPLIFINSADAETARLFTLIHELAHLWLGSSGISDGYSSHAKVEVFCNAIAGEFLVPKNLLIPIWNHSEKIIENLFRGASKFHVSKLVVARRAMDCGLITKDEYRGFYQEELNDFRNRTSNGGDFYRTAGAKNSLILSRAVVTEALSGRLLLRDASKLLGVAPHAIKTYASKLSL